MASSPECTVQHLPLCLYEGILLSRVNGELNPTLAAELSIKATIAAGATTLPANEKVSICSVTDRNATETLGVSVTGHPQPSSAPRSFLHQRIPSYEWVRIRAQGRPLRTETQVALIGTACTALVCAALLLLCATTAAYAQKLASTPPMGWNSWNHFAGKVTDADVRSAADQLVSTGMRDAGYIYVNLDDTWQGERDSQGVLHPNSRFPDMKALADYIHSKGLKFGIYSSPGANTCGGYAGSLGHEMQDAKMYAYWGVDYLKYDLCSFADNMRAAKKQHPEDPMAEFKLMILAYRKMGDALKTTGRPILYSLCEYGVDEPWKFGPGVDAQMWRTTDDINDTYGRMMEIAYNQAGLARYAGPGHWNDPDMLEIGNGGMSYDEYKTHMTLWVLLAAPLLAGNDLSKMSAVDQGLLTNREAIAIDQDPLGRQAERVWQHGDFSLWRKPLADGRTALGLVNNSWQGRNIPVDLSEIGFRQGATVHDVWAGKDLGHWSGMQVIHVPKHGAGLYIVGKNSHGR
jgi:alpha-galactosidase